MLPEDKQTSDNQEIQTAYAAVKMAFSGYVTNSRNRERGQKENGTSINI